jgi:hypothetical protein
MIWLSRLDALGEAWRTQSPSRVLDLPWLGANRIRVAIWAGDFESEYIEERGLGFDWLVRMGETVERRGIASTSALGGRPGITHPSAQTIR